MIPLLYIDDDFLIVNKPWGLAVQLGKGLKTSVVDKIAEEQGFRPWLVHRLDMDSSGVLVMARTKDAAALLSMAINSPKAIKRYLAVCSGLPEPASSVLDAPVSVRGREQTACSRYRTLSSNGLFSIVEVELGTGRNHQIRRQFADAGWPLAGDDKYGNFKLNRELKKEYGLKKLLLHASYLFIPLEQKLEANAPLPDYFADFCKKAELEVK